MFQLVISEWFLTHLKGCEQNETNTEGENQ